EPVPRGKRAIERIERALVVTQVCVGASSVVKRAEIIRLETQCGLDVATGTFGIAQPHLHARGEIKCPAVFRIRGNLGQCRRQGASQKRIAARLVAQRIGCIGSQRQCLEFIGPYAMRGFEFPDRTLMLPSRKAMPSEVVMRLVELRVEFDRTLKGSDCTSIVSSQ